jgi:uncharacterized OB-fold protein
MGKTRGKDRGAAGGRRGKLKDEILVAEQTLQVPFNYSAGPVASRFLIALRDEKKIMALKCPGCGRVTVPPRALCGGCGKKMEEWVEVGPAGELVNFTEVHYHESVHPAKAPFAIGIVKLEGASTGITHLVRAPGGKFEIGMRVKAVFADKRRGHYLDIECFEPA